MIVCLKLHGIGAPPDDVSPDERSYWIDGERFRRIVDLAVRNPQVVRLTFDDGNISDVEVALPALRQAGLKASFFFSTDFIGRPGYAGEDDIRALSSGGMEVGSHGCRHDSWQALSGDEIAEDVICSLARLEAILGKRVSAVAPPYGDCNYRMLKILRKQGVGRVYSGLPGPSRANDWLVRRMAVTAQTPWDVIESWMTEKKNGFDWLAGALGAAPSVGPAAFWRARRC